MIARRKERLELIGACLLACLVGQHQDSGFVVLGLPSVQEAVGGC
jgi:hypothetical protein